MQSNQLIPTQLSLYRNIPNGDPSGIQTGGYSRFVVGSYMNPSFVYPPVVPSIYPYNNFTAYTVAYPCHVPVPEVVAVRVCAPPLVSPVANVSRVIPSTQPSFESSLSNQCLYSASPTISPSTSPSTHPSSSNAIPSPMSDSQRGSFSEPLIEFLPDEESTSDSLISTKTETKGNSRVRNAPRYWKKDECDRLRKAISLYGSHGQWKLIANHVGTRTENQCINKWKNDLCKHGNRKRWNSDASRQLEKFLKLGLDVKAIQERMPAYTYIQIYQQIEKRKKRRDEWKSWEIEKLKELKNNGIHSFTEIGNLLNNRHCDDVKNMWKKICSSSF